MKTQKPTSLDIAARAGVSQPTVSRALRNSPLVSEETRARIFAIARELNYQFQTKDTEKNTKTSRTFSVLFAENPADAPHGLTPFHLSLLNAVTRKAACLDYGIHLGLRHLYKNWNYVLDDVLEHSDGVIFIGNKDYMTYKDKLVTLHNRNIPFTVWGPVLANQIGTFISYNNLDGGFKATQHLIKLGHKRIAFLGNVSDFRPEFAARYHGYTKALLQADIIVDPKLRADAQSNDDDGYAAIKRLIEYGEKFTAVFCATDTIALSAMRALDEYQRRIPEDVAIVGFDDIPISAYVKPPLTTVKQDTQRAGELQHVMKKCAWTQDSLQQLLVQSVGPGNIVSLRLRFANVQEVFEVVGEKGVTAERVAGNAINAMNRFLHSGVCVGEYLADQLLLPMVLAAGGEFLTGAPSMHTRTNIDVIGQISGKRLNCVNVAGELWSISLK